jgi:methyl-accepting chemotaxis protein
MKFIENVRIRTRMMWLAGVTLVSLIALGAVYMIGDRLMSAASHTADEYRHLEELVRHAEVNTLDMRRKEKDFLLRSDMKYAEQYAEVGKKTIAILDEAAAVPAAAAMQADIRKIRGEVESHIAQFQKVVALQQELGLTEKEGLQGNLRAAVHSVETKLAEANLDPLTVKMLMMRRHEKDFMLRGDEKYIGDVDKRRAEFDGLLAGSAVPAAFKQEVSPLMDEYQKNLRAWAAVSSGIGKGAVELGRIFATVEHELEEVFKTAVAGDTAAAAELASVKTFTWTLFLGFGVVILVLSVGLTYVIARSIVVPISNMTAVMSKMAEGDNTQEVPAAENKDEVGEMARAVLIFKQNALERVRLEEEQRRQQAQREKQMERMAELTQVFDQQAKQVVASVAAAADELQHTAENMSATAEETNRQAAAVAAASEQATANVQTVASASEEMSASIAEINRQAQQSAETANRANAEAERTNATVQGLAEAAQKIGEVVSLISEIAEQTNLLALNATIEAARAGEAGKGFAVVASEVKNLANQTAKATDEISSQVTGMQSVTADAVGAIKTIGSIINEIKSISDTIASAVDEQGLATREIAENTQQAAAGTQEVSSNIVGVTQASSETGAAAQQVLTASGELSKHANSMRTLVESFLTDIKAA